MTLIHPKTIVDTTFSGKDISTAASVYQFTAPNTAKVQFVVKLTNAKGGGDYTLYLTHKWLNTGAISVMLPKTTTNVDSGVTVFEFPSLEFPAVASDVFQVMILGRPLDNSVSGAIRITADNPSVYEAQAYQASVDELTTNAISFICGDKMQKEINNLGSLVGYVSLDFSVKTETAKEDDEAILRVRKNASGTEDGLIRLMGGEATATDAYITIVDAVDGDIVVTVLASATRQIEENSNMLYDVQVIMVPDEDITTPRRGYCSAVMDITQAVS